MSDTGVDVSNWNAVSSWAAAKAAGVAFGLSKATEGLNYLDPTFHGNWAATTIFPFRGAYHFGHPANDPIAEAAHFFSVIGPLGPTDWWMLDMETTDGRGYSHAGDWSAAFCAHMQQLTGKAGLFYSYLAFIRSLGASAGQLTGFPLAEADYSSTPPDPSPWAKWTIWQRADNGRIPGIAGNVDLDQLAAGALAMFAPSSFAPRPPAGLAQPACGMAVTRSGAGYWIVARDGGIFALGDAGFHGSAVGTAKAAVVAVAATPSSLGYWLASADGGVFAYGDAQYYGSMGGHPLSAPVVGIAASPSGKGYWLVAADGGVFAYGDAGFYGSMGSTALAKPIVSIEATPTGAGYWLVAADGGVFAHGDAGYYGSMGSTPLAAPVMGMDATPSGKGYWMVAADGGVFAFGDAGYYGSMGGHTLNAPVVGIASSADGRGDALVAADGGVFAFGDMPFEGVA